MRLLCSAHPLYARPRTRVAARPPATAGAATLCRQLTAAALGSDPTFPQAQTAARFPPAVHDSLDLDALLTPEEQQMRKRVRAYMVSPGVGGKAVREHHADGVGVRGSSGGRPPRGHTVRLGEARATPKGPQSCPAVPLAARAGALHQSSWQAARKHTAREQRGDASSFSGSTPSPCCALPVCASLPLTGEGGGARHCRLLGEGRVPLRAGALVRQAGPGGRHHPRLRLPGEEGGPWLPASLHACVVLGIRGYGCLVSFVRGGGGPCLPARLQLQLRGEGGMSGPTSTGCLHAPAERHTLAWPAACWGTGQRPRDTPSRRRQTGSAAHPGVVSRLAAHLLVCCTAQGGGVTLSAMAVIEIARVDASMSTFLLVHSYLAMLTISLLVRCRFARVS